MLTEPPIYSAPAHSPKERSVARLRMCGRLSAIVSIVAAAGCASFAPPQPWEKGVLARPDMQFDADPLGGRTTQHIYTSKEAATGGYGVGGGGCGCN